MVENVLQGYNSTAMAYGVTGSGKTHTMFGDIYSSNNLEKGICVYAVDHLFELINNESQSNNTNNTINTNNTNNNTKINVKLSYLEIYNEQVIDLLVPVSKSLMIVEDPIYGVSVPELTEYEVRNTSDILKIIIQGNERRTMAPTGKFLICNVVQVKMNFQVDHMH